MDTYTTSPSMFKSNPGLFILFLLLSLAYGIGLLFLLIWYLKVKNTKLTITEKRTSYTTGILSRSESEIRNADIRNIQVKQGIFQRMMGTYKLAISTAGQSNMEIEIDGITDAPKIKDMLYDFIS